MKWMVLYSSNLLNNILINFWELYYEKTKKWKPSQIPKQFKKFFIGIDTHSLQNQLVSPILVPFNKALIVWNEVNNACAFNTVTS